MTCQPLSQLSLIESYGNPALPLFTAVTGGAAVRYAAFISYSHQDRKWANWLHRAIETYRAPKDLAQEGNALSPVFLDRAELPTSSDLAESVREALSASRHLIVICSPAAARSRW